MRAELRAYTRTRTEGRAHRNVRIREVGSRIIPVRELTRRRVGVLPPAERAELEAARPQTRGDCIDGPRPCPFVACVHHLYLDVNEETGGIKLNFPDLEPDEMRWSCSLDIADAGGVSLEVVAMLMNLTRESARLTWNRAAAAAAPELEEIDTIWRTE